MTCSTSDLCKQMRHIRRSGLLAALAALVLDQVTKAWALAALSPPFSEPIFVLPMLNLRLGFNAGVTFGLFAESAVWLLLLIMLGIVAFLGYWLWRSTLSNEIYALGLIIGGALGNIADRLCIGAVVDFIDAHYSGRHWPTFNMADVAIVCGVSALIWVSFRPPHPRVPT